MSCQYLTLQSFCRTCEHHITRISLYMGGYILRNSIESSEFKLNYIWAHHLDKTICMICDYEFTPVIRNTNPIINLRFVTCEYSHEKPSLLFTKK